MTKSLTEWNRPEFVPCGGLSDAKFGIVGDFFDDENYEGRTSAE